MSLPDIAAILDALRTAIGSFTRIEKDKNHVEPDIGLTARFPNEYVPDELSIGNRSEEKKQLDCWFIAVERFDPNNGEDWDQYVQRSGLIQLREVVSFDVMLCPHLIREFSEEDWRHNVHELDMFIFFRDLEYLFVRVRDYGNYSILAVVREPNAELKGAFDDKRFTFYGYDIIEVGAGTVSAISNCGGFAQAFSNDEINEVGLISNYDTAKTIQNRLIEFYPDEPHANCDLWAIWRMDN